MRRITRPRPYISMAKRSSVYTRKLDTLIQLVLTVKVMDEVEPTTVMNICSSALSISAPSSSETWTTESLTLLFSFTFSPVTNFPVTNFDLNQ